jgi:homoserine O-succinyltransferase
MPIKIPADLPARKVLDRERVPIITEDAARRQDIRPLRVAILNLMPNKIETETHLLRAMGATPLQIEVTLLRIGTHESKNTPLEHLTAFYQTHEEVAAEKFDAMIVTGAPVEMLPFEEVKYWDELKRIFDWAKTNVYSTLFICWGAQAALFHYHGIPKHVWPIKKQGIHLHKVIRPLETLTRGFDDEFGVPVARQSETLREDVLKIPELEILVESDKMGLCLLQDATRRRVFMFNHLEYEADTIQKEYMRDVSSGMDIGVPHNYFPDDDPSKVPRITWRAHRNLLFSNWINMVYQGTPYDLEQLEPVI